MTISFLWEIFFDRYRSKPGERPLPILFPLHFPLPANRDSIQLAILVNTLTDKVFQRLIFFLPVSIRIAMVQFLFGKEYFCSPEFSFSCAGQNRVQTLFSQDSLFFIHSSSFWAESALQNDSNPRK